MVCAVLLDYHAVALVAASNKANTRVPCQASVSADASNHSTQQQRATCKQQKQPTNSTFVIDSILRSSRASLTRRYHNLKGHLFGGSRTSRSTNAKSRSHAHNRTHTTSSNSRNKPVLHRSAMSVPTLAKHRSINVHRRSLPDDYTGRPTTYCRPQQQQHQQQQQQQLIPATTTSEPQADAVSAGVAAAQQHSSSCQQQQQWRSTGPPSPFAAYSSSPFAAAAAVVDHPHSPNHRITLSSSGRRKIQVTKFNSIQLCRQQAMSLSATAAAAAAGVGGRQLAAGTISSTATAAAPHTSPEVGLSLKAHFVTNPLTPSQQLPSALDVTISNINRRWLAAKARDIAVIHEFSSGVFYCAPNSEGAVLAAGVLTLLQQAAVASAVSSRRHMYKGAPVIPSGVQPAEVRNKIHHLSELKTAQSAGVSSGPAAAAAFPTAAAAADDDVGCVETAAAAAAAAAAANAAPALSLISLDSNSSCGSHTDHTSHPNPHHTDLIVCIDKRASSNYSSEDPGDTGIGSGSVSGSRTLKTTGSPGGSSNSSSGSTGRTRVEEASRVHGPTATMPVAEAHKTHPLHKARPISAPAEAQSVSKEPNRPRGVTEGSTFPAATQAATATAGGNHMLSKQGAEAVLYPLRVGGVGVSVSKVRQADCTGDVNERPSSLWFKVPHWSYKVVGCVLQRTLSGRSTC